VKLLVSMGSPAEHFRLAALDPAVRTFDDVLADYAREAARLHGLDDDEAQRRFARFMAVYHLGAEAADEREWAAIRGGDVEHTFIRLSKPYRFAEQQVVPVIAEHLRRHLEGRPAPVRVLDFGGGSGNDAIVYARMGFEAHYADLVALKNTDVVARRFAIRGLSIPVHDSGALPDVRFDAITAVDVLEHIYDQEAVLARLMARIAPGGLLLPANAYSSVTYDGDHLDKNRVYVELFPTLMARAGFVRIAHPSPLEVYRRAEDPRGTIAEDEDRLAGLLYATTRDICAGRCRDLLAALTDAAPAATPPSGLPSAAVVGRGSGAVNAGDSTGAAAPRRDWRAALLRSAVRHAPLWLRHRRARRREIEFVTELRSPATDGQALAALADYASALRIAEHRLATRR
jgi:SAM-dependent methyltransferase